MSGRTSIEWTDRTWNPVRGCAIVSKGCTNCYAMKQAHRFSGAGQAYAGLTRMTAGGPVWTGKAVEVGHAYSEPLRWKKPARVFVNSMSDLFHPDVSDVFIADVFAVMAYSRQHMFQVLTKRPERMRQLLTDKDWIEDVYESATVMAHEAACEILGGRGDFDPNNRHRGDIRAFDPGLPLSNVWMGVSVEDQAAADARVPVLLDTPAAVRFISAEPLLAEVDLSQYVLADRRTGDYPFKMLSHQHRSTWLHCIDWVICGGESGPGARPVHPDWVRVLRDQCQAAGVSFFFKQWGNWMPSESEDQPVYRGEHRYLGNKVHAYRIGKKRAGRLLDGREWNEMPRPAC